MLALLAVDKRVCSAAGLTGRDARQVGGKASLALALTADRNAGDRRALR